MEAIVKRAREGHQIFPDELSLLLPDLIHLFFGGASKRQVLCFLLISVWSLTLIGCWGYDWLDCFLFLFRYLSRSNMTFVSYSFGHFLHTYSRVQNTMTTS